MTFEEWNSGRDWWKTSTEETMQDTWDKLSAWGVGGDDIGDMLDAIVSAMSGEYGN